MLGRQAKLISASTLSRILRHTAASYRPERDTVIILLSVKAGLRACEIAGLRWSMLTDDFGRVGDTIQLEDRIAKRKSGRRIPIHPQLKMALKRLGKLEGMDGPVVKSARGGGMRPNSIVNWFVCLFRDLDLVGCSSHSGRRTFITTAARNLHRSGGSLRDVQILAGHRSIEVTQRYIEGDSSAQRKLVALV